MQHIIIISGILNLAMGVVVLFGSPDKKRNLSFVLFSFTTFLWALSNFLIYKVGGEIFIRLAYSLGALLVTFLFSWASGFIGERRPKIMSGLIYAVGLIFSVLPLVSDLIMRSNGKTDVIQEGPLYPLYVGFFIVAYAGVIVSLVMGYRNATEPQEKTRTRIILLGLSLYGAASLIFSLILPLFGIDKFLDLDVPSSIIFVAFTTYVIVRYHWMNVKVIIVEILAVLIAGVSFQELFLAESPEQRLSKGFSFLLVFAMAVFMVRGVRSEVRRKEELQSLSNQLSEANAELRRLDDARKDFVSIATHQLKTPLTWVKGVVSMVLDGDFGAIEPQLMEIMEKMYANNERVAKLIDDLLNTSRIESGRMEFKFAPTDIVGICKEVTDTLLFKAKDRKLSLELELPAEKIPELMIDGPKVREIISNIVDNAVKYTKSGGVTVKVERVPVEGKMSGGGAGKSVPSGGYVRITVSDTGIGIPQEELQYLFSKFSRGKDLKRLNAGGTGLGLFISRSMIEANGGRIWAESDGEGKGSRFVVELPVRRRNKL